MSTTHSVQPPRLHDAQLARAEIAIAYLLRYGVLVCAAVLCFGWFLAVTGHGSSQADFASVLTGAHTVTVVFPQTIAEFLKSLAAFDSVTWIETGLFLLIALPISRVF